jgi:uncharacterized membrane protein HdeD (DUF308 family)
MWKPASVWIVFASVGVLLVAVGLLLLTKPSTTWVGWVLLVCGVVDLVAAGVGARRSRLRP